MSLADVLVRTQQAIDYGRRMRKTDVVMHPGDLVDLLAAAKSAALQQAGAVPDALYKTDVEFLDAPVAEIYVQGWNDCRAAMRQPRPASTGDSEVKQK